MVAPPRIREPELMDAPELGAAEHAQALAGLARLNWVSRGARAPWHSLRRMARGANGAPLTILDLATGSGDIPVALDGWMRREGLAAHWILADRSTVALARASKRARTADLRFAAVQLDATCDPLPACDIAMCNTLLHHFDPPLVEHILHEMGHVARLGGIVADLRRSRFGPALVGLTAQLVTRSPIVHIDAIRSMRAAYTAQELHDLAVRSGLDGATVERVWPARLLLTWHRPQ